MRRMTEAEKEFVKLPPSQLIRAALRDLTKIEKSQQFVVDMGHWSTPLALWPSVAVAEMREDNGKPNAECAVCFAGSVMQRLDPGTDSYMGPSNFPDGIEDRLLALDLFRSGEVQEGLTCMRVAKTKRGRVADRQVTPYRIDRVAWRKEMLALARDMERAGL